MSNTEQFDPMELIQQVKEIVLLDSNLTMRCVHCKVIFPKEYGKCPQCETDQSFQTTKFNILVDWE